MAQKMICSHCGTVGKPKRFLKGSGAIELVLYLCGFFPGLLYSAWRSSGAKTGCPGCSAFPMVPLDTPAGKKLLEQYGTK